MMHPKMLRRILTVAREKLAPNERFGFVAYFDVLKRTNEKAPQHQKQAIEELLVQALAAYLPQRWRHTLRRKNQRW